MRATLMIQVVPEHDEESGGPAKRVDALAEKLRKAIGAESFVVRSGAGYHWEITFS